MEGALYVMKDNTKEIVVALNKGKTHEDARHHKTIGHEIAQWHKMLELEHRWIILNKETNPCYIRTLLSLGDGLCLINVSFRH